MHAYSQVVVCIIFVAQKIWNICIYRLQEEKNWMCLNTLIIHHYKILICLTNLETINGNLKEDSHWNSKNNFVKMSYNKKLYYYYYLKRCDINVTVKLHKYMNFCPITELIYPDHIPNHIPENISSDAVYNFIFSYILLPHLPTMLKWCILPYFIYNITEEYTTRSHTRNIYAKVVCSSILYIIYFWRLHHKVFFISIAFIYILAKIFDTYFLLSLTTDRKK